MKEMQRESPQAADELAHGEGRQPPDVAEFIEKLRALDDYPVPEVSTLFDMGAELVIARAPGRLDVMGGIADYSGSLVLELPIAEATFAAVQRDDSNRLRIVTMTRDGSHASAFEMPLADFESEGAPVSYEAARQYFADGSLAPVGGLRRGRPAGPDARARREFSRRGAHSRLVARARRQRRQLVGRARSGDDERCGRRVRA